MKIRTGTMPIFESTPKSKSIDLSDNAIATVITVSQVDQCLARSKDDSDFPLYWWALFVMIAKSQDPLHVVT
jgi:hypothetical protein